MQDQQSENGLTYFGKFSITNYDRSLRLLFESYRWWKSFFIVCFFSVCMYSMSACLSAYLSVCLSVVLAICMSAYLSCLPAVQPIMPARRACLSCLHVVVSACVSMSACVCMSACICLCLPVSLPSCVPVCLSVCLPACLCLGSCVFLNIF